MNLLYATYSKFWLSSTFWNFFPWSLITCVGHIWAWTTCYIIICGAKLYISSTILKYPNECFTNCMSLYSKISNYHHFWHSYILPLFCKYTLVGYNQKYSRLRCLLRVKGLVICFYLGWSGSTLVITKHVIKVGSKS